MSILVEVRRASDKATIYEFEHVTADAANARLTAILTNHPTSDVDEPQASVYANALREDGKMVWKDRRFVITLPPGVEEL